MERFIEIWQTVLYLSHNCGQVVTCKSTKWKSCEIHNKAVSLSSHMPCMLTRKSPKRRQEVSTKSSRSHYSANRSSRAFFKRSTKVTEKSHHSRIKVVVVVVKSSIKSLRVATKSNHAQVPSSHFLAQSQSSR